jgi:uncharacterized protein YqjF (DUF2071 family)
LKRHLKKVLPTGSTYLLIYLCIGVKALIDSFVTVARLAKKKSDIFSGKKDFFSSLQQIVGGILNSEPFSTFFCPTLNWTRIEVGWSVASGGKKWQLCAESLTKNQLSGSSACCLSKTDGRTKITFCPRVKKKSDEKRETRVQHLK